MGTTISTSSTSVSSTSSSISSTSSSTSSTSISTSSTSKSTSSTSKSTSTSSTSYSTSSTSSSTSSTSSSISSTSSSSTSASTSISSTSSSISSTSYSSTSTSSTSSSSSISSTSTSISSTSFSMSSTSLSTSSTSVSTSSTSSSTSTTAIPYNLDYTYQDAISKDTKFVQIMADLTNQGTSSSRLIVPVTANTTLHNTVFVVVGSGNSLFATSVTDTQGNLYYIDERTEGGTRNVALVRAVMQSPLTTADSIIVTISGATTNWTAAGYEYSGIYSAMPTLDRINGASGSAVTTLSAGSTGTLSYTPEVFISAISTASNLATYTEPTDFTQHSPATPGQQSIAEKFVTTTAAIDPSWSWDVSANVSVVVATYRILPKDNADLLNSFTNAEYSDVSVEDGNYFIEYGTDYVSSEYKYIHINNTDNILVTWRGRSTYSPQISPLLLQIYNNTTSSWDTLVRENRFPADTDFQMQKLVTSGLTDYYSSSNQVVIRVYQQVI